MEDPMMFFITTPNKKTAVELAQKIVKNKIAACANIIDQVTSIYWWKDEINTDEEIMMVVKTIQSKARDLINFVHNNHPYEVPECVGVKITIGSDPYLQWIYKSIGGK